MTPCQTPRTSSCSSTSLNHGNERKKMPPICIGGIVASNQASMMSRAPEVLVTTAPHMPVVMAVVAAETCAEMITQRGGDLVEHGNRLSRHGKGDESECEGRTGPGERTIEFVGWLHDGCWLWLEVTRDPVRSRKVRASTSLWGVYSRRIAQRGGASASRGRARKERLSGNF